MRLPDDVIREVFPWDEYMLARVDGRHRSPPGEIEDDLFAGRARRMRRRAIDVADDVSCTTKESSTWPST